jgi:hypothetical protein
LIIVGCDGNRESLSPICESLIGHSVGVTTPFFRTHVSISAGPGAPLTTPLTTVRAILLVVDRVLARLEVLAAVHALPHARWRIGSLLHRHLFSGMLRFGGPTLEKHSLAGFPLPLLVLPAIVGRSFRKIRVHVSMDELVCACD